MIDRDHYKDVNSLEDLTAAIELYNTLIGLGRFDEAVILFSERLEYPLIYRLGASLQSKEMLELLFPEGLDQLPRLNNSGEQAYVLNELALSIRDQPGRAAQLYRRVNDIDVKNNSENKDVVSTLCNQSNVLRFSGDLRESESVACQALIVARQFSDQNIETSSLCWLGLTLAARGSNLDSSKTFKYAYELLHRGAWFDYQVYENHCIGLVWLEEYTDAQALAKKGMTRCQELRFERGIIRAARLQGEAALGLGDLETAEERLHNTLAGARKAYLVEEELPALIGLAELVRRKGDLKNARDLLDDVWEPCERGPFKLYHADAYNVLAQIERDAANHEAATKAAKEAYRLAWCDGPPFAYHWGLQKAKAHLAALGSSRANIASLR